MGNKTFYGKAMVVDTSAKFTVIAQFITSDGTSTGSLAEILRLYIPSNNSRPKLPPSTSQAYTS
ncbi:glycoside hydrolase family 7 protein [Lepidopterella palustris CBS 459.81]|uniref:cellulose 1,4-beta-cellobiosidase (non-reducing end) n=1 Tax=Lepidopterella palustris CBS 459.81 TaxID=1314670 RepID=A0A8E2E8I7_9PEZI|nr:glycoside hydrolase family 7 protein [Lepidopterella palustris CBS 459.81]